MDTETERFAPKKGKTTRNVSFICGSIVTEDGDKFYYTDPEEMAREGATARGIFAHNAAFDYGVFDRAGVAHHFDRRKLYCTHLMAHLYNQTLKKGLDDLSRRILKRQKIDFFKSVKGDPDPKSARTRAYVINDASLCLALGLWFWPRLEKQKKLGLFLNIDMPTIWLTYDATNEGILTDDNKLKKLQTEYRNKIAGLEKQLHKIAGEPINLNSPKQLPKLIYRPYFTKKVPTQKDGTPKTDQKTMGLLPAHYFKEGVKPLLIEYRKLSKFCSTYIDKFREGREEDGLNHAVYNVARTESGRLSSGAGRFYPQGVNIQNIPARDPAGEAIKDAVMAKPGTKIALFDASQIELRMLAHLSQDPVLLDAYRTGKDLHAITASAMFGVPLEKVTSQQRAKGKTLNFATLYGTTAFGLHKNLEMDEDTAGKMVDEFFNLYKKVASLKTWTCKRLRERESIVTLYGRVRYFPRYNDSMEYVKSAMEREAFSTLISGSAADLMKECLVRASKKAPKRAKFFLQVHDEFGYYVPVETAQEDLNTLIKLYEKEHRELRVPVEFDGYVGDTWYKAKHGPSK